MRMTAFSGYNSIYLESFGETIMGISMPQLLIILLVVALIFGTKKLRNIGSDLGSAVKGFKKGMADDVAEAEKDASKTIDATAEEVVDTAKNETKSKS